MRKPFLSIAIAFVLAAPCSAVAQSPSLNFQKIEHEYKPQKDDGSGRVGSPTTKGTTTTPTIGLTNPALKGDSHLTPPPRGYDLKANKER
jgi:hypothetical protein